MRPLPLFAAALVALTLGASAARSDEDSSDRFHSSVEARSGGRLELSLDTGAGVVISTWDRDSVEVTSERGMRACPDAELTVDRIPGGVRVATRYPHDVVDRSCSLRLIIHLPRKFDVSLRSSGGSFEATGLDGLVTGQTGGGEIRLAHMNGAVRLSTGGGSIHVEDSTLDGHLTTGGGSVKFDHVTGRLVGSSGSMTHSVRADRTE